MKKYFRIVLKGPQPVIFFDLEVDVNLLLPNFWQNAVLSGVLVTEKFCVPYDQIAHISVVTVEQVQPASWKPTVVS